jgi:hypothetical protein
MRRSDTPQTPHPPHKEVLVKVNAYVDEGLAPLVEVLNTFDKVHTWESCQGKPEGEWAYVLVGYGTPEDTPFEEMATFANRLAFSLAKHFIAGSVVVITIEWSGYPLRPFIKLEVSSEDIEVVTLALSSARQEFESSTHNKQP